jgi:hypothetical protein
MLLSVPTLFFNAKCIIQSISLSGFIDSFHDSDTFFNQYRYAAAIIPFLVYSVRLMIRNWMARYFRAYYLDRRYLSEVHGYSCNWWQSEKPAEK